MSWNLHVTGSDLAEDLQTAVADFVKALEAIGHTLDSAVLTTDAGTTTVPTTPAEAPTASAPTFGVPTDTPPDPTAPVGT
jgi:hypothetical protein